MDSYLTMSIITGMFTLRLGNTFSFFVVRRNSAHLAIADDERLLRVDSVEKVGDPNLPDH